MDKEFDSLKDKVYQLLGKKDMQNIDESTLFILKQKFSIALDWHNMGYDSLAINELESIKFSILTAQTKKPKRPINIKELNIFRF